MSYNIYKNGILPNAGGWLDQSYKYINIMTFIDAEIMNHQREQNGKK
jgi:hypothetical protein